MRGVAFLYKARKPSGDAGIGAVIPQPAVSVCLRCRPGVDNKRVTRCCRSAGDKEHVENNQHDQKQMQPQRQQQQQQRQQQQQQQQQQQEQKSTTKLHNTDHKTHAHTC